MARLWSAVSVFAGLLFAACAGSSGNGASDVAHDRSATDGRGQDAMPRDDAAAWDVPADAALDGLSVDGCRQGPDGSGCGGVDLEAADEVGAAEVGYPDVPTTAGVRMEIQSAHPALPFPFDWFTAPEPESPTGLLLSIEKGDHSTLLLKAVLGAVPGFAKEASLRDGFGSLGLMALPLNTQVDPLAGDNPAQVTLCRLSPTDGFPAEPLQMTYKECVTTDGETLRLLEMNAIYPLAERTGHLLLVRRGMTDVDGNGFEPSPMAEVLLGLREPFGTAKERERMALLRDRTLEALSQIPDAPAPSELAAAVLFTVGTMTLDMVDAVGLAAKEEILVDLDPDGDGTPNILTPSEYPPYGGSPPEGVGLVVEGRFRGPDMRDENGFVGRTVKGGPAVAGHHWRDFFLLLPAAPFAAPFKLVTLQHGLDSHKESELGLAAQIAQQGHAVACFDFLHHGKGESGGGFAFIQIDSATKTVGNFRQSALDLLSFVAALEKLANDYDLDGDGKDGGDLAPDLDLSSVVLAGHSLGALESAIAASLAPMPRAAGLIAGGGNFRFLFESVLKKRGLYDMVPVEFMLGFSLVASLLMSDADPAAFAQRLMTAPGGSEPCPFLLLVVLEDGTIPEPCAEAFTLAANAPIILPVEVQWPGALLAQAADTTFGTIQMHGTHEFIHSGDEAGKMGRKVLFHYIQSFFESGQPEILWPVE